jgi:hypothetical protein
MTDQPHRDDLAQLRAQLAEQQARLARLERRRRFPRRALPLIIATLLVALMPLSILAANPVFGDLGQAAEVHRADIQALGNAGITTGFDDPTADDPIYRLYDPKGTVTREQMASFLARTAGLGGNAPVANAKMAQTASTVATNPVSGTTYAANELLRVASGHSAYQQLSASRSTLGTVTIQAPAAGYVLLNSTLLVASFTSNTNVVVQFSWENSAAGVTGFATEVGARQVTGEDLRVSASPLALFPVPQAGMYTYNLQAQITAGTGTASVYNTNVTALYVPFGATGTSAP